MPQVECPACKMKIDVGAADAGKSIACPKCRKSVLVPAQPGASGGGALPFRNVVLLFAGLAVIVFVGMWVLLGGGGPSGPNPVVVIDTTMGSIKVELYPDKAPITVANFLKYVDEKHYDGTIFHRVIADFMIQGGGFDAKTKRERPTGASIKNEAGNGLSNTRGTIAMARTNNPDSATDQFFINVVDNKGLDRSGQNPGYAVFGRVIDGMDVVDKIRSVPTFKTVGMRRDDAFSDAPVQDVVIKSIRRVETK